MAVLLRTIQGFLPRADGHPPSIALQVEAKSSKLHIEIVAIIVEHLVLDYQKTKGPALFTPRWYLIPILLVCKQWHSEFEKHMYRAVAVGSHAPFDFPARDGEATYATDYRYHLQASNTSMWKRSPRQGHRVAEDLRRTLSKNSRLAELITKLQLGINPVFRPDDGSPYDPERDPYLEHEPEWMETNVRILQLCPNVEHVDIRGFEASELDALVNVLKNKSLLSFQISSQTLCGNFVEGARSYSHIFDMMESWPKLRSIKVLSFMSYDAPDLIPSGMPQVSPRCPDLRDIEISGALLRVNEVARMRAMCCGGVTRLSVSYLDVYASPGAIVALCDCLRANHHSSFVVLDS